MDEQRFVAHQEAVIAAERNAARAVELARAETKNQIDTLERYIALGMQQIKEVLTARMKLTDDAIVNMGLSCERQSVARYDNLKESLALQSSLRTEAITKAEESTNTRFASVNEFRAVLTSQQATYVTRTELGAIVGPLAENAQKVETASAQLIGRQEALALITPIADNVQKLDNRLTTLDGRSRGSAATISYIVMAITLSLSVVGGLIAIFHH